MPVTSYSTTSGNNNAAAPNGAPEGVAPSAINNIIRQVMTDVAVEAQVNAVKVLASVAGTNTITGSMTPDLTAYSAGMMVIFKSVNANTAAATLNIDGLGAKSIVKGNAAALAANDLLTTVTAAAIYDGTNFELLNPQTVYTSNALLSAYKTATTSRSSNTSLTNDPHLVVALGIGTFAFDLFVPIWCTTSGAGEITYQMAFSGTATSSCYAAHHVINATSVDKLTNNVGSSVVSASVVSIGTSVAVVDWIRISGTITISVAGNLSFQWCQSISNANALNVGIGGWLRIQQVA